jgi:myosin-15
LIYSQIYSKVRGFLDKNRDLLRSDVIDLFSSSRNDILANMFRDIREVYESHRGFHFKTGRFITMKAKTPTVSAKFSDSLAHLIDTMTRCQPTFIRCIKPNNDKTPNKLELSVVLEQLRNTGMLETVRIRKLGFPRRYLFEQFAKRYRCLITSSWDNTDSKEITIHILNNLPTKFATKYQIGITKVNISI